MTTNASKTNPIAMLADALGELTAHDVSPVLSSDLPMWFMYEAPQIEPLFGHAEKGAAANRLTIAEHTGTHVDAPFHFDPDGLTADRIPVESMLLRPFKKFDLSADEHQPGDIVGLEHLRAAEARGGFDLGEGDVAVLELGWDRYLPGGAQERAPEWWGRNQPGLSEDACRYLADTGVSTVACDTAACDIAVVDGEFLSAHGHTHYFLPRGILIVEGLTGLGGIPATGLFLALPLKIAGGTGSPVRVVLLTE
ncbi:MAG: cyclase family protein [Actinobacteria bacterium]|nr:cyclase family protein [Actinomycetota bacterium]